MAVDYTCRMPPPGAPLVDQDTGYPSTAMWHWMLAIFKRLGGDNQAPAQALAVLTGATQGTGMAVPLTPSPMTYKASQPGTLLVDGGGMVRLELTANDDVFFSTGSYYGAFPMTTGSLARLTYVGSPNVTFIQGERHGDRNVAAPSPLRLFSC